MNAAKKAATKSGAPCRPGLLGLAALVLCLSGAAALRAATYTVTSNADSGAGSLPSALASAASEGGGTIVFNLAYPAIITLASPLLIQTENENVTLSGPGSSDLTISGGNATQIFNIAGSGIKVAMSGLTLANGEVTCSSGLEGAALYVDGGAAATLTQCQVLSNTANTGGCGALAGAIFVESATLTLEQCSVSRNTLIGDASASDNQGAALQVDDGATVTINRSVLDSNSLTCPACSGDPSNYGVWGGAIYTQGTLVMNGCQVTNNVSGWAQGVLYQGSDNGCSTSLYNCTFSGNQDGQDGAVSFFDAGTMDVVNCTITDNTSDEWEAGLGGYDGGTVTLQNDVIAGNTALSENGDNNDPPDVDIFFDLDGSDSDGADTVPKSKGYNFIGQTGSQDYSWAGPHDTYNTSGNAALTDNLAGLADNLGYGETVGFTNTGAGVYPASPASPGSSIGGTNPDAASFVDGRGFLRPGSFSVVSEGAYQVDGTLPVASPATTPLATGFTANWAPVANATGYLLDVATDAGFNDLVAGYDSLDVGDVTSKAVSGLPYDSAYHFRVRAYDGIYDSWYSTPVTGTLPSPTLTFTPSWTVSPSPTRTPSISPTWSVSPTGTPSASPTLTASPTNTPVDTQTWTVSPTPTDSTTPTPTFTISQTWTDTSTDSPTLTATPTGTPTLSGTLTDSPTLTATPTDSPTATPTFTATLSFTDSPTATLSATRTATATKTQTSTLSPTWTYTSTSTPSGTRTDSPTRTPTSTDTGTRTASPTRTASFSPSPTRTASATATQSPTLSPTWTHTPMATPSDTRTASPTRTPSFSPSPTRTASVTASETATISPSFTVSSTFTVSPTFSVSPTISKTFTASLTPTVSQTFTASLTPTVSQTFTVSPTPAYARSSLGDTVLAPVPVHRGDPVCLYFKAPPLSSSWTVYSVDQQVVARLSFGSQPSQCFTNTQSLAAGVYWVELSVTYEGGQSETKVLKMMVLE